MRFHLLAAIPANVSQLEFQNIKKTDFPMGQRQVESYTSPVVFLNILDVWRVPENMTMYIKKWNTKYEPWVPAGVN